MTFIRPIWCRNKSDAHYFWMGKCITVVGIVLSIVCAYVSKQYNNAMDIIQLVFGFVNAPLFATMLLGMFWKRATGTGAFLGLFAGIAGSTVFHAFTTTVGNVDAAGHVINHMKGGYLGLVTQFPSEMAQNFWLAIFAFTVCFLATVFISLATRAHQDRRAIEGSRLFAHAQNSWTTTAGLAAASGHRHGAPHCLRHFKHHFLVN